MAVGRYFNLPDSKYMRESQYVPLPFDSIAAAGAAKQNKFDESLDTLAKAQDMIKINANPAEAKYRDYKVKQYNDQITSLADEIMKSGDTSQAMSKVRNIARNYANDPEVKVLNQNHELWQNALKDTRELSKEGKYDSHIYDEYGRYAKDYNPFEQGLKQFDYQGTLPLEDWGAKALALTKDIAADQTAWADIGEADANGMLIDSKGESKHITNTKVGRVAANSADAFLGSTEGRYWIDQKLNQLGLANGHVDYYNLDPKMQAALKEEATKDIYNLTTKQIFEQITIDKNSKFEPESLRKERILANLNAGVETGNPEAGTTKNLLSQFGLDKYFNNNGKLDLDSGFGNLNTVTFQKPGQTENFVIQTFTSDNARQKAEEEMQKQGYIVRERKANDKTLDQNIKDVYNKSYEVAKKIGLNVSSGETPQIVWDYFNNISKKTSQTAKVVDDVSNEITKSYLGKNSDIHNTEIYRQGDIEGNVKATTEDINTIAENSQFKGIDYFAPKQAGFKLAVTPKDETGKNAGVDVPYIMIPRDQQFKDQTKPVWEISRATMDFASKGEVNSDFDALSKTDNSNLIKFAVDNTGGKYSGSSIERDNKGNSIYRIVTTNIVNNEPQFKVTKINIDNKGIVQDLKYNTLEGEQEEKTTELNKGGENPGAFYKHIVNIKAEVKQ